jgi:VWFA-related protein
MIRNQEDSDVFAALKDLLIPSRTAVRLAGVIASVFSLTAQESRFEARSRMVLVPVTVNDANGRVVDGLEASDFQVLDNGQTQKVVVDTIATGVAPIALAIAVQSSGISYAVLEKVRTIGGMIRPLIIGERGCAALFSFAERVRLLQSCTNDTDALEGAFRQLRTGEPRRAVMLDAVYAGIEELRNQPNSRRVLLLISETKDRGSETELDVAVAAAQAAGVTLYAATYSAFKTAFTSKTPSGLTGLQNPVEATHKAYPTVDGAPPPNMGSRSSLSAK